MIYPFTKRKDFLLAKKTKNNKPFSEGQVNIKKITQIQPVWSIYVAPMCFFWKSWRIQAANQTTRNLHCVFWNITTWNILLLLQNQNIFSAVSEPPMNSYEFASQLPLLLWSASFNKVLAISVDVATWSATNQAIDLWWLPVTLLESIPPTCPNTW